VFIDCDLESIWADIIIFPASFSRIFFAGTLVKTFVEFRVSPKYSPQKPGISG
jgi:hypothetical protein